MAKQLKQKMFWLILLVACIPFVWTLVTVDDWRRDWTTNFAETRPGANDPWLRPLTSPDAPPEHAEKIARWAHGQRNWSVAAVDSDAAGEVVRIHLVRTTPLLRFRDDIHVTLTPTPDGGSVLTATSQSRVGKGDLGQNPRNIKELTRALADE